MNTTNIATYFTANEMTAKSNFPPNTITFTNANTWVMRITADRRIEVNEDVAVTEAAQAIFDALERYWQKKPWVGLTGAEVNHIFAAYVGYPERMMTEVERLLKEKNT
jgi:acetylglutamate kinase